MLLKEFLLKLNNLPTEFPIHISISGRSDILHNGQFSRFNIETYDSKFYISTVETYGGQTVANVREEIIESICNSHKGDEIVWLKFPKKSTDIYLPLWVETCNFNLEIIKTDEFVLLNFELL